MSKRAVGPMHTDAEKEEKRGSFGYSDMYLYKFMFRYVVPYKWEALMVFVYIAVYSLLTILGPLIIMATLDRFAYNLIPFAGGWFEQPFVSAITYLSGVFPSMEQRWLEIGFLSVVYLVIQVLIFFVYNRQIYKVAELGLKAEMDIRIELFTHLQELDMSYHDRNEVGRIMSRLTSDLMAIRQMLGGQVINNLANIVTVIAVLFIIVDMDAKLSIVSVIFIPIAIVIGTIARKYARPRRKETRRTNSILMANIGESIAGIKATKSMNRENKNIEIFESLNFDNYQSNINADDMNAVFFPILLSLSSIGIAFIILVGGFRVVDGILTVGILAAFLNYNSILFRPVIHLGQFYQQLQDALTGAERISALFDTKTKVSWNQDAPELPLIEGKVEFRNINFEYVEDEPIYENLSFTVPVGKTVALVGPTGAGKTTIINILSRLYDYNQGVMLVDDRDVRDYSLKSYRDQIATVPQDFFLFSGSVRENLKLGNPLATEDQMWAVLERVGLKRFVEKLPMQLDTELYERGSRLSTGQKQLMIFAAVLLADPRILILDEATSSIDVFSEIMIQEAMEILLKNRTSFIIAHRLTTIKNADLILVIAEGEIVEQGTHEELLAEQGRYYELVKNQIELAEIPSRS